MKKNILSIFAVLLLFLFLPSCYISKEDKITETISQEVFEGEETLQETAFYKEYSTEVICQVCFLLKKVFIEKN